MKCVVGLLLFAAIATISALPAQRRGMVFYQPDYYNAHRAFVMQYASQPIKAYRRNGQASGVTAYASGKKIAAGTYLKDELNEEDDHHQVHDTNLDGGAQAVADGYADEEQQEEEIARPANDVPEDIPEVPLTNKKTPVQLDEEDDEAEEEEVPVRSKKNRGSPGSTYFPVTFGSTNGGAIAIANSYSTGKGGSASSRATAYGSAAKPKRRVPQ